VNGRTVGCLPLAFFAIIATCVLVVWTAYSTPWRTAPAAGNAGSMAGSADESAATVLVPYLATMIVQQYSPTPEPTNTRKPEVPSPTPRSDTSLIRCDVLSKDDKPCIMFPPTKTPTVTPTIGPCPSVATEMIVCYPKGTPSD
jgi:hypothetical protein